MLTLNKILGSFENWCDIGTSYDDESVLVYSGDLWELCGNDSCKLNRLQSIAESRGIELRFYDETLTDEQGRVHNTQPTHWGWTPTYAIHDCVIWAEDEAQDHVEEYAEYLIDNDNCADQFHVNFQSIGFKQWEGELCESGFHYGQNDTPESLRKAIESAHGDCELIFYIDSTGQFDMRFGAWYRPAHAA